MVFEGDGGQAQDQSGSPNAFDTTMDVGPAATVARYWSSNRSIITVTADGNIVAVAPGEATVTAVYQMGEALIPVQVTAPQVGPTPVTPATGGVVRSADGYEVAIAPGALSSNQIVTINSIDPSQLLLPSPQLSQQIAGAFQLDVGAVDLMTPAQLALPVLPSISPGSEIFFFKEYLLPGSDNQYAWLLVDNGVVGSDGIARTNSPPYPGIVNSGRYLIATPIPYRMVAFSFGDDVDGVIAWSTPNQPGAAVAYQYRNGSLRP